MDTLALAIIIQAFIFGGFCAFIAKEKHRDQAGWFFLGLIFSLVALLALIAVPKLDKTAQQQPKILYPPASPPTATKTKLIRLAIILLGILAIIVVGLLLKK